MLPVLPKTDIFSHKPDADNLDLWDSSFFWDLCPDGCGVYCFYDANTGEPLYVGSACARSSDPSSRGNSGRG